MNMLSRNNNYNIKNFPFEDMLKSLFDTHSEFAREFPANRQRSHELSLSIKDDTLTASMPCAGCRKENFDISIANDILTVRVKYDVKEDLESTTGKYILRERSFKEFEQSLKLPTKVIPDSANAQYQDGVLQIIFKIKINDDNNNKKIEIS